jgi:hypothetical protein
MSTSPHLKRLTYLILQVSSATVGSHYAAQTDIPYLCAWGHNPHSPGDLVVCNKPDTNMLSWPRWRKFSVGNNLLDYTVETHKVVPFDRTRNNQWQLWFGTSWAPCVQYVLISVNEIILTWRSKMAWKPSDYLSSHLEGFMSIHRLTISKSPLTTEVQFCSIWEDTTWPHTIRCSYESLNGNLRLVLFTRGSEKLWYP